MRLGANDQIANILFMADGLLRSMLRTLEENILDDLGKCYTENVIKHVKYLRMLVTEYRLHEAVVNA